MTAAAAAVRTYRTALMESMRDALAQRSDTIILGQGVTDHRGTFGTTLALHEGFGRDRVIEAPLCEESTTGVAIGAALNGAYPIHVHIRADFGLLAMNQIINLAAKYRYMSGGRLTVPMLIRMVIGRSWGQGAQHSQSLQALLAHIPGLTVIMPATAQAVTECYAHAVLHHSGPVISFEHRLLYDLGFRTDGEQHPPIGTPFGARLMRRGSDVTIVATSIMVIEALRAAEYVQREAGISCDIIDLNCISQPDTATIFESLRRTGRLIVADTSWRAYGVAAEIPRLVCETDPGMLKAPVITLGMAPAPCPTAKTLEDLFYPTQHDLVDAIARLARGRADHGVALPEETSMTDVYKRFKGPF